MTTFTGTNGNDIANTQTGTLTGFTGGTVAQLQDGAGDTFNASGGNDTIVAGGGDDILDGAGGADNLDGAGGSDTYNFDSGDVAAGERITDSGTSGTDTIKLNSGDVDFTAAQAISGIEALLFTGSGQQATFKADQLPTSLAVTGVNSDQSIVINNAVNFSAAGWTLTNWTAGTDTITINGTAGADAITGSSQRDTISGGAGNDVLDGGAETDVAQFAGARSAYTIERLDSITWRIVDTAPASNGDDGTDTISNFETANFANGNTNVTLSTLIGLISDSNATTDHLAENAAAGALPNITARAVDGDSQAVTYSLQDSANGRFSVNASTGVVTVASGAAFNFETESSVTIRVRATSTDASFTEQTFTIAIDDVNEGPSGVAITNATASIAENTSTATHIKVCRHHCH